MRQNRVFEPGLQWKTVVCVLGFLTMVFGSALIPDVQAQQTLRVWVDIEEADSGGCADWELDGPPDIYWDLWVDGHKRTSVDNPISPMFSPFGVNLRFPFDIDASRQTVPVVIQQWDEDWPIHEQCDLDPAEGDKELDLTLDLTTTPCQISGDASGACGTSMYAGRDSAKQFKFKITVEEPPVVSGLSIRCLHDPIWPKPDSWITIAAEALDGNANPIIGGVEELEIWVDDHSAPQVTTTSSHRNHSEYISQGTSQILYRCRAKNGGLWVSSGWRMVQVGEPAQGRAVPILYAGYPHTAVDIAFIADRNDYTGPDDPQFLTAVHDIIRDSYYASNAAITNGGRIVLFNQDLFNFWIAKDTGHAVDADSCLICDHELPSGWDTEYSFVDAGAIVHTTAGRDFAERDRRIFSARTTAMDNFLHEAGHSPFGLADEYCCDTGYFQPNPHPNIYSNQEECRDDALANGVGDACRQIEDAAGNTVNWFRVESAGFLGNDLMDDSGDHTARPADERRINWYLDKCRRGGC